MNRKRVAMGLVTARQTSLRSSLPGRRGYFLAGGVRGVLEGGTMPFSRMYVTRLP